MENRTINPSEINGWGIDADPENEPTYPMKHYTGDDHDRLNYDRPVQQEETVRVYHSNERPSVSAVFGTSAPPSGLSGAIRKHAFKYSENHYGHWLTLLAADRVNVVEGVIRDIARGKFPNIFAEKGWKVEWKFNRKELMIKTAVTVAIIGGLVWWLTRKRKAEH